MGRVIGMKPFRSQDLALQTFKFSFECSGEFITEIFDCKFIDSVFYSEPDSFARLNPGMDKIKTP
jgi:hypothetical protein